jgi:hypothetical protein
MSRQQHRRLRRGVEAYLDRETDPALSVTVRRHLAECWRCSEDAEWLVLLKATLAQVGSRRPTDLALARLTRFAYSLLERQ